MTDQSEVAVGWRTRFDIMEKVKAGDPSWFGDKDALRQLQFGERSKINFNLLAALFGVIYYCVKGMWAKGILMYALVGVPLSLVVLAWQDAPLGLIGIWFNFPFAVLANYDYYHKIRHGERLWPWVPSPLSSIPALATLLIASQALWVASITYVEAALPSCSDDAATMEVENLALRIAQRDGFNPLPTNLRIYAIREGRYDDGARSCVALMDWDLGRFPSVASTGRFVAQTETREVTYTLTEVVDGSAPFYIEVGVGAVQ